MICFGVAGLFGFISFVMLSVIVAAPSKFVLCFTITMIALIVGLAFLNGPRKYMKKLFTDKNLYATIVLLVSLLLSLYFSLVVDSYVWSIIFCIAELNAVLYFFCRTSAVNWNTIKWVGKGATSAVKSKLGGSGGGGSA